MPRRLLIAGCGDLGIRLASRLSNWQVAGLRRRVDALPSFVVPLAADLSDPASLAKLDRDWDAVVYTATPGARDEAAYRRAYVQGLEVLLQRIGSTRLIFVSSTAVFGQQSGEWVDEDSATNPTAFNGRVLLEAEAIAHEAGGTVVRFSGIYGPGRTWLLNKARSGSAPCRRAPPEWTNRIHADDCAGVLAHVLEQPEPLPLYLGSDLEPAPRWDVLAWLAEKLDAPGPVESHDVTNEDQGKRISSERLRASGFEFEYPDFRAGYSAMIAQENRHADE